MTDTPWLDDACSLAEAIRSGERSPADELERCLAAIEASDLNAFSYLDPDRAREQAARVDTTTPFAGIPSAVKELDKVAGWPDTEASLVFADRTADYSNTWIDRGDAGGLNRLGLTTASEFGGLNVSVNRLNGVTGNPWNPAKTAGGSSGGSAAAVAGGLVPIATGGDGGGSIRIPAAFNGLVGMKGTAGRIPRGPHAHINPLTVVVGCLARSVRDVARYYDVCAGYDTRDPYSLPTIEGWERDLDTHLTKGLRVGVSPDLGGSAVVLPELGERIQELASLLIGEIGATRTDVAVDFPPLSFEWVLANMASLVNDLGGAWPDCKDDLTNEMAFGLEIAEGTFDLATFAKVEHQRTAANEAMASVFDQVDLLICATNPDVACDATVTLNTRVGDQKVGAENNGALTIPANISGNPAISIPAGLINGLPVGMQVIGRHHADPLLLDVARVVERIAPWPLTAPGAPV